MIKTKLRLCINDWTDILGQLVTASPHVFWLQSLNYKEHLFHSAAFSSIWEAGDELLYQHPRAFDEFIVSDNRDTLINTWLTRHESEKNGVALYKIKGSMGSEKYIRDYFTTLYNESGEAVAAAGLAMEVTSDLHDYKMGEQKIVQQTYGAILLDKLNLIANANGNPFVVQEPELSKREQQCIYYLLQNKTAKQTAEILHLSRRTVEKHLENIKIKFHCSQKMELLKTLLERNYKNKIKLE